MFNKRLISSCIIASLSLFIGSSLHAGIYKWVDENGQVHYGDRAENTAAEEVNIRHSETTKPRVINEAENPDANKTDKAGTEEEKLGELKEVPPSQKEKRKLCNEAKSDLAAINSRGRMREINKKGEYSYLSEQQRQQRISAAQKKQREYCR